LRERLRPADGAEIAANDDLAVIGCSPDGIDRHRADEAVGAGVTTRRAGDHVCLHYLVTCGGCRDCRAGREQFCATGQMIGKDRDGGFAEFIRVPAGNAHDLPDAIPFEQGAILMCSSATALHALRKARVAPGDAVAVFGIGGLGVSAIQLARALGAAKVYAVDVNAAKLALAQRLGAIPIDARTSNPVQAIREATDGRGVDGALELIGLARTMEQAVEVLAPQGRAALAGLTRERISIAPYRDILNREAEIIGVSDHFASEIPELMQFVASGALDGEGAATASVAECSGLGRRSSASGGGSAGDPARSARSRLACSRAWKNLLIGGAGHARSARGRRARTR
jgi:propanol-preferring alcohol dehydrogenase